MKKINFVFGVIIILTHALALQGQQPDFRVPGTQRQVVEGNPVNNNVKYSNDKNVDKEPRQSKKEAKLEAQLIDVNKQATDAYRRGDFSEALQLYYEQQKLRDGPNVKTMISQCKELIAEKKALNFWEEGRGLIQTDEEAALNRFKNAIAARPATFNQECLDFVTSLEKMINERKNQQQQNNKANADIQNELKDLLGKLNQIEDKRNFTFDYMVAVEQTVSLSNTSVDLRKDISDAITKVYGKSPPGVQQKVERGFQAIMVKDWKLAKAWFEDALYYDPGNPGLISFINLCASSAYLNNIKPTKDATGPVQIQLSNEENKYLNMWITRLQESVKNNKQNISLAFIPPDVKAKLDQYVYSLSSEDRDKIFFPDEFQMGLFLFDMQTQPGIKPEKKGDQKTTNKAPKDNIHN